MIRRAIGRGLLWFIDGARPVPGMAPIEVRHWALSKALDLHPALSSLQDTRRLLEIASVYAGWVLAGHDVPRDDTGRAGRLFGNGPCAVDSLPDGGDEVEDILPIQDRNGVVLPFDRKNQVDVLLDEVLARKRHGSSPVGCGNATVGTGGGAVTAPPPDAA